MSSPRIRKYNKQFAQLKKVIFDRDKWQCLLRHTHRCKGMLDVHHVNPRSLGGDNSETNLITVCRHYHSNLHIMGIDKRRELCINILRKLYGDNYT